MTLKTVPIVLLFSCCAVVPSAAIAGDGLSYTIEDVTACSPDAMRLCKDKLPDLDAIQVCMKSNYEHLRPACKARFDKQR